MRIRVLFLIFVVAAFTSVAAFGQEAQPSPSPTPAADEPAKPSPTPDLKAISNKPVTADQIAETTIFIYGLGGGRPRLDQIRKTTIEKGHTKHIGADGKVQEGDYETSIIRASDLYAEKIRMDRNFADARYSLIWADGKTTGVYGTTFFTPDDAVVKGFEDGIFRGLEAFLRYKENGSTLELAGREKDLGVEYFMVDVTDKSGRKTRFYISVKSFQIKMLTYEQNGVKYKRKFYDYNYVQGTLVPSHSILWADGKVVEDTQIKSISFGQQVNSELFATN
ncbi:MAG: hypothetical protein UZ17_ACD001002113 [Acidobacteria bacterium OLB17]|nr:MAG: hypothetical protein UZ17_ACD001002113 [Acidobacteria bacterium OLB17]MCZ2389858.1 hypothetical protein [Acidobacteriota bacterium]